MSGRRLAAPVVVAVVLGLTGCSAGPSTQEEVCAAYDSLSGELRGGHPFDEIDALGDTAARYEEDDQVRADGEALQVIADQVRTDGNELNNASMAVAALCGRPPLTISSLIGG